MTREHIWPKCIIERVNYSDRYSERAAKVFSGDATISDVCADCNNGVLSGLDGYIAQVYDAHFAHFAKAGQPVEFRYDYDLLLRWLLKLSYNTARTVDKDIETLKRYVPYVLGNAPRPADASVVLQLVAPSYLARKDGDGPPIVEKKLYPKSTRSARVQLEGKELDWCVIRVVSINSFYFYIVLTPVPNTTVPLEEMLDVMRAIHGTPLDPEAAFIRLETSRPDLAGVLMPHMQANLDLYQRHLQRKKQG